MLFVFESFLTLRITPPETWSVPMYSLYSYSPKEFLVILYTPFPFVPASIEPSLASSKQRIIMFVVIDSTITPSLIISIDLFVPTIKSPSAV